MYKDDKTRQSSRIDTGTKPKVASKLNENQRQIKERDNCRISTRKDTTEEIQKKCNENDQYAKRN